MSEPVLVPWPFRQADAKEVRLVEVIGIRPWHSWVSDCNAVCIRQWNAVDIATKLGNVDTGDDIEVFQSFGLSSFEQVLLNPHHTQGCQNPGNRNSDHDLDHAETSLNQLSKIATW